MNSIHCISYIGVRNIFIRINSSGVHMRIDPRLTANQTDCACTKDERFTTKNILTLVISGARCSYVVKRLLVILWVVGLIPHGGHTELFLISTSAP